jgi:hypothetical protein
MAQYTSRPSNATLDDLQRFQDEHDATFHNDVYMMFRDNTIRHIHFHLSKVLGHIGDYLEKRDHSDPRANELYGSLLRKDIPDLLAFSLILASKAGIKLDDAYFSRIREIEARAVETK